MAGYPLVALKSFPYAGRVRKPGDLFSAHNQSDARMLKAIGMATDAPIAVHPPAVDSQEFGDQEALERKIAALSETASETLAEVVKPKRSYVRRAPKAEGEPRSKRAYVRRTPKAPE